MLHWITYYTAHNVTMAPGDLVLYESHSVIHGRPFRMWGNFYANIFVHFEPLGLPLNMPDATADAEGVQQYYDLDCPPYLIPGSSWEVEWREENPNGWTLMNNAANLVQNGDLQTLRFMGKLNPSKLHEDDGTPAKWRPIHEAARQGSVEVLKYLIEEHGANVNELCLVDGASTPLKLAQEYLGEDHPACAYLASVGGVKELVMEEVASSEEEEEPYEASYGEEEEEPDEASYEEEEPDEEL